MLMKPSGPRNEYQGPSASSRLGLALALGGGEQVLPAQVKLVHMKLIGRKGCLSLFILMFPV